MSKFVLQPVLENDWIKIRPLKADDFETLYQVASDPLIWEQHPNKNRYQRDIFNVFFQGAMASGGAFLVFDARTHQPIGSSRYYDWNEATSSVLIGYTFLSRDHWGGTFNPALKRVMIHHAFQFVTHIVFHIGAQNTRSQRAIERLGAIQTGQEEVAYYGEPKKLNLIYQIHKEDWIQCIAHESI